MTGTMRTGGPFRAVATPEPPFWVIHVEGIGTTQAHSLGTARSQAAGLVMAMLDLDEDASVDIDLHVEGLDPELQAVVDAARAAVDELAERQIAVGEQSRQAVATLADNGLSGRDIAAILHITPSRVSQLSKT